MALEESTLFTRIATKVLAIWLGILVLAIVNGALREMVLIPVLGNVPGLILSGVLLSVLILAMVYISMPWLGPGPVSRYVAIGLSWLCLTIAFEFTFGRLILGKPWPELFEAYTFQDGNIWPVVLLAVAMAPYIAARIRGWE